MVELNRAVAVGMAFGPEAGLRIVDGLAEDPSLLGLSPAAGGAGRPALQAWRRGEARAEFERAASLTGNSREREVLQARALELDGRRP